MKKVLIQLDTDDHPSAFDAIAAYDAGVDVVIGYGGMSDENLEGVVQGAMFPRGPEGLQNTAFWVGGRRVRDGEDVFEAARECFFGPFTPSIMLDSNGSNTTAAATVARVRGAVDLKGARAAVIGVGPVGVRTAELLRREDADASLFTFPPDVVDGGGHRRASGIRVAEESGFQVHEPDSSDDLDAALEGHSVVFAAGPAGTQILRRSGWQIDGMRAVIDYSAAEPVGVEGVEPDDDLAEEDGILKLGALAAGGPKMKLQKRCVQRMFEDKGSVLDLAGIYEVALSQL